jgi:hypothetical protein
MGRPSKLTKEQWLQAEHRHVVDGVTIDALSIEFGVSPTALRRKLRPTPAERAKGIPTLRHLAARKAAAADALAVVDNEIAELPETRQIIVNDLASRMKAISVHLSCAAETSAATAHKLTMLANAQANRIDPTKPINDKAREIVSSINAITKTANEAGAMGLNLIAAHRVGLPGAADTGPDSVADLTDEELAEEMRKHGIEPPQA